MTPSSLPGLRSEVVAPAAPSGADRTSGVCLLLGEAEQGPRYEPVALRRADAFSPTFGPTVGSAGNGFLGPAVEGYFANGGSVCYVVRVDLAENDWLERAWAASTTLDDADLVAVPDLARAPTDSRTRLGRALLDACATRSTRFAILDAPDGTADDAIAARAQFASRFGALYHPWISLADGRRVPPSGHVAGVFAQSDSRAGVAAAPANIEVVGAVDLQPAVAAADADALYAAGVNPLRALPGRGIRVWGARSLAGTDQPEWRSIGVSRLFIALTRWLAELAAPFVFAPNDLALWVRVRRELSARLWELWRRGDLAGATPEAGFYVKCDAETNPVEVREAGLMVTEIGVAPTVPAEFVVVRLVQQDGRTVVM